MRTRGIESLRTGFGIFYKVNGNKLITFTMLNGVFDAMIAYWHDHDCVTDYYMMHLFLALALRRWPETTVDMPRLNGYHCIMMGDWINKGVSKEQWDELTAHVAFHKLNYRKIGNREMEIIKALT